MGFKQQEETARVKVTDCTEREHRVLGTATGFYPVYPFYPCKVVVSSFESKKKPAGCAVSRVLFRREVACARAVIPGFRRGGKGHLSGPAFASGLRGTNPLGPCRQAAYPRLDRPEPRLVAAWPCTRWGLPCRRTHALRGALLPHLFTLTLAALLTGARRPGGSFSVALSLSGWGEPRRRAR